MNRLLFLMILTVLLFCSCSESLISDLSRSSDDPFIEAPGVESFTDEYLIKISWTEDDCADEYVLYRSIEGTDDYSVVYRGNNCFYDDSSVESEDRFLYRLVKMRGDESFGPSSTAMGIGSITTQDEYEPNDSEAAATAFEYDLSANTYYYVSQGEQHTVMDIDWYSIEVRPNMKATFEVSVPSAGSSGDTGLYYYINPELRAEITNGGEIKIENETLEKKTFYFSIYPNGAEIVVDSSAGGGGELIPYSLSYLGETLIGSD